MLLCSHFPLFLNKTIPLMMSALILSHFVQLLFEIFAYGEKPYLNWSNAQVWTQINKGYRLPMPLDCPQHMYDLMLRCWAKVSSALLSPYHQIFSILLYNLFHFSIDTLQLT